MATIAITSLPAATAAAVTDVLPIVQSGTTKQITNALLFTNATLVAPALGTPTTLVGTNITGTASGLTAGNVTTNANLTGAVTSVGNATSLGSFTSANLASALTDETGTGANVFANTPTLVTPNIGAATGTSLAATGAIKSSGTAGIGYATGAGGVVIQGTSRTTGVTINKITGQITLFSAAGTTSATTFTVTNSLVNTTDVIILNQHTGADLYDLMVTKTVLGSFDITFRTTGGTTTEQPIFNFTVIKGVDS
jgi:hypothetical protein